MQIGTFFTKHATFHLPFRFDLVDISRQFLVNFAGELYADVMEAYQAKDILSLAGFKLEFINLLNTLDTILGSNEHFLLGRQWLNPAKSVPGANDEDKIQYEYNARNQITLWGPEENIRRSVIDYAGKGPSLYYVGTYGWVGGPENGNFPLLYVVKMS